MTQIIISPGTEPRPDATEDNAAQIIRRFIDDLGLPGIACTRTPDDDPAYPAGYYAFRLSAGEYACTVDVPGVDPDTVQLGKPWRSSRLYVNGSSWLWGFALGFAADALTGGDDDES